MKVGSLAGRSKEVLYKFERKSVDIGCLEEVRYWGQGIRIYGGEKKFWWSGSMEGRNGVGNMVKEDLAEEVIEVKRLDDRMMKIAMVCGRKILHVFSVYAAQQEDLLMVAGYMNCHI